MLVYSEFVSAISQTPRSARLLPAAPETAAAAGAGCPIEIEPSAEKLLAVLVPKAIEVEIFRALLENQAGEHAARMTAMESATRNTEELIAALTLQVQPGAAGGDHQGAGRDRERRGSAQIGRGEAWRRRARSRTAGSSR